MLRKGLLSLNYVFDKVRITILFKKNTEQQNNFEKPKNSLQLQF